MYSKYFIEHILNFLEECTLVNNSFYHCKHNKDTFISLFLFRLNDIYTSIKILYRVVKEYNEYCFRRQETCVIVVSCSFLYKQISSDYLVYSHLYSLTVLNKWLRLSFLLFLIVFEIIKLNYKDIMLIFKDDWYHWLKN